MGSNVIIYATRSREEAEQVALDYAGHDPFRDPLYITTRYCAAPLPNGRWGVKREWYVLGIPENVGADFMPLPPAPEPKS